MKEQPESNTPRSGNLSSIVPILVGIVLLALAFFVTTQVIGVLYGIIFPAAPPLPEQYTQLEHTSEAYGVDEWLYSTSTDACEVARYYDALGRCVFAPGFCRGGLTQDETVVAQGENVAQCTGEMTFSIFAMQWRSNIATGYKDGDPTRFQLSREVFWTGSVPKTIPE